jgi:hypothetical protein
VAGFGERAREVVAVEVGSVCRCAGLLAPRLVQAAGADGVEAELLDKARHGCLAA